MVGRISSPRFVGRVKELDALERLLSGASDGRGAAVLVAGEAGIGKSRLVSELEQRAREQGMRVLSGECVPLADGELAFAPVISALREVAEDPASSEGLDAPLRLALTALWPASGAGTGWAGGREQLFEAILRLLVGLAEKRPVLLVVEDVQWIDRSSRDLFAFLVRNARHERIALVATYRSDELHRGDPLRNFIAELERSGRAGRVELEPLDRAELAEQLEAIAGCVPSASQVEEIFARCEGNPFFAEELLASADLDAGELPPSLRETLLLRAERVSDLTRRVLRVAGVVGRSVDHRLLAGVAGVGESQLTLALREAIDHHLLVPRADGIAYAFRHALVREAIYDDTLLGERLRLHRAIAESLEAHSEYAVAEPAAELAYHWLAAGERSAALRASVQAASEAAGMRAYREAAAHMERALELWDRVPSPDEVVGCDRVDLLLRASQLAEWAGEATRGLALAEQARAQVDPYLEPLRASAAERRIGRAMHYAGRGADAIEHLVAARRLVPKHPPSREYAEALVGEGRALMVNGMKRDARERLEEAIPLVERLGDRTLQTAVLSTLTIVYSELGEFERAIAAGREGLRIAQEIGSAEDIVRAYINGSQAIDNAGRIEEALALGREGISVADRLGMSRGEGDQLRGQAAWRLQRIGRLAEADRMLQWLLENATSPFIIAACHGFAGRIAVERGELDRAERLLARGWALMQDSGGFQLIGPALAARVLLEIRRGDLDRARERARDGVDRAVALPGDLEYTAELYWLAVRVEAELAERARALRDHGALADHELRAVAIRDALARAISEVPVALEVGSPPFLEEVAGLARRAGVSLGAREDEPVIDTAAALGLTPRELEVLRLLADGRTNRQIADQLFISPKTASVHVSRILMKLGVSNRAAAAAAAHRMGLAPRLGVE
jgi:DNA-binding CsgD family transcriptional regulator/tetratricopeptide (TPR) repeat protein